MHVAKHATLIKTLASKVRHRIVCSHGFNKGKGLPYPFSEFIRSNFELTINEQLLLLSVGSCCQKLNTSTLAQYMSNTSKTAAYCKEVDIPLRKYVRPDAKFDLLRLTREQETDLLDKVVDLEVDIELARHPRSFDQQECFTLGLETPKQSATNSLQIQSGLESAVCDSSGANQFLFNMSDKCYSICDKITVNQSFEWLKDLGHSIQLLIDFIAHQFVEFMLVCIAVILLLKRKRRFDVQCGRESSQMRSIFNGFPIKEFELPQVQGVTNILYIAACSVIVGTFLLGGSTFMAGIAIGTQLGSMALGISLMSAIRKYKIISNTNDSNSATSIVSSKHEYKIQSGTEIMLNEEKPIEDQDESEVIGPTLADNKPLVSFRDNTKMVQLKNGVNISQLNEQLSNPSPFNGGSFMKLTSNRVSRK